MILLAEHLTTECVGEELSFRASQLERCYGLNRALLIVCD